MLWLLLANYLLQFLIYFILEKGKLADPFYRLEHQEEDLKKKKEAEPVIVRLQRQSDARHSDDYSLNKTLRAQLRVCYLANDDCPCLFFIFLLLFHFHPRVYCFFFFIILSSTSKEKKHLSIYSESKEKSY